MNKALSIVALTSLRIYSKSPPKTSGNGSGRIRDACGAARTPERRALLCQLNQQVHPAEQCSALRGKRHGVTPALTVDTARYLSFRERESDPAEREGLESTDLVLGDGTGRISAAWRALLGG